MLKSSLRTNTAERRRHPRISLPLHTQITVDGNSFEARLKDISIGGLSLEVQCAVPASEHQAIQLVFSSQIGILEIRARIVRMRELIKEGVMAGSNVAIRFEDNS